jgi:hypothetical protein
MSEYQEQESKPIGINTILALPIVRAGGFALLLIGAGWAASGYANSLTNSINALASEVSTLRTELRLELDRRTADKWSRTDMRFWGYDLEKANSGKIIVPAIPQSSTSP